MAWQQIFKQGGNFGCCGAYSNDQLFIGGYGSGDVYAYPPFRAEASNTGEAVLSMVSFKGTVYGTSENNDSEGGTTRVLRRVGSSWEPVNIDGYAAYFCCVWGDNLVVTTSPDGRPNYEYIDVWLSSDGVTFGRLARLSDWLWVPVVYKGELYLLGHGGSADATDGCKAVKWTNAGFQTVGVLTGISGVAEWQCGIEAGDYLFLGAGSWTAGAAAVDPARVYRFDGSAVALSKTVAGYNEASALGYYGGTLYAGYSTGFKVATGNSVIYASTDLGTTWSLSHTVAMPNLYALFGCALGVVAVGGGGGYVEAWSLAATPIDPLELAPPTDVELTLVDTNGGEFVASWTASTSKAVNAYEVIAYYSNSYAPRTKFRAVTAGYVLSPTTRLQFSLGAVGYVKVAIKAYSGFSYSRKTGELVYTAVSDASAYSNLVYKQEDFTLAPPLYLAGITPAPGSYEGSIYLEWPACPQTTLCETKIYYRTTLDGALTFLSSFDQATTSYTFDAPRIGASYLFYAMYRTSLGTDSSYTLCSVPIVVPGALGNPSNVAARFDSPSQVKLTWVDNSVNESVFEVYRWTSSTSAFTKIVELAAGTQEFTDNDVSNGIQIAYQVKARTGIITSDAIQSNTIPEAPSGVTIVVADHTVGELAFDIDFSANSWHKYSNYPQVLTVQLSEDGSNWTTYSTIWASSIETNVLTVSVPALKNYYLRLSAANGAGAVYSNVLLLTAIPALYTVANVPDYLPGDPKGRTVVVGKDGAGELDFALSGLADYEGYTYVAKPDGIGTLDAPLTEAELVTQPIGDMWFGLKTVYSVELEATANRDVVVQVNSRADYKDRLFRAGKEVSLHRLGRTGYIKEGNEFEVSFKWRSGSGYDFVAWGGRVWLKSTGRQGLNTLPQFFGKYGYFKGGQNG